MKNAAKILAASLGNPTAGLANAKRAGLLEPEFSEERGGLFVHFRKAP